ncbi:unnamed protein product [Bathycoccus prasinos]
MLITERISNPSPRGIHLRQSGFEPTTSGFGRLVILTPYLFRKEKFCQTGQFLNEVLGLCRGVRENGYECSYSMENSLQRL